MDCPRGMVSMPDSTDVQPCASQGGHPPSPWRSPGAERPIRPCPADLSPLRFPIRSHLPEGSVARRVFPENSGQVIPDRAAFNCGRSARRGAPRRHSVSSRTVVGDRRGSLRRGQAVSVPHVGASRNRCSRCGRFWRRAVDGVAADFRSGILPRTPVVLPDANVQPSPPRARIPSCTALGQPDPDGIRSFFGEGA